MKRSSFIALLCRAISCKAQMTNLGHAQLWKPSSKLYPNPKNCIGFRPKITSLKTTWTVLRVTVEEIGWKRP